MSRIMTSVSTAFLCQFLFLVATAQNYLQNNLEDISVINIPRDTNSLTVEAGETVVLQCQSVCGEICWTLNGESVHGDSYLPYCETCSAYANVLNCNAAIIDKGPIVSNLTVSFDTPGQHSIQCHSKMHGDLFAYSNKKYKIHSGMVMVIVTPGMSSTISSVPTSSQYQNFPSTTTTSLLYPGMLASCTGNSIPKTSSSEGCTITSSILVTTTLIESSWSSNIFSSLVSEGNIITTQGTPHPTLTIATASIDFTNPVHIAMICMLVIVALMLVISWMIFGLYFFKCRSRKRVYNSSSDNEDSTTQTVGVCNSYRIAANPFPPTCNTSSQQVTSGHCNNTKYKIDVGRSLSSGSASCI